MPFDNGYRGAVQGSVQTSYTDQPGLGVPGMLAYASDNRQMDSVIIGEADGIAAGLGIIFGDVAGDVMGTPAPPVEALLPTGATTVADFEGITVFDEAMQSDENGVAGWANQRMGRILRPGRSGGRVFVRTKAAVDHTADSVHLVITANATFDLGDFAPSAQGVIVQAGASVAGAGNTGDGAMGAIASDDTAKLGDFVLVCAAEDANAGDFTVYDPEGVYLGILTVAVEFVAGGLTFTLADGAADFLVGDSFVITVTESGAESIDISSKAKWRTSAGVGEVAVIELIAS